MMELRDEDGTQRVEIWRLRLTDNGTGETGWLCLVMRGSKLMMQHDRGRGVVCGLVLQLRMKIRLQC